MHTKLRKPKRSAITVVSVQKNTIKRTLNSSLPGDVNGSGGCLRLMTGAILQDKRRHGQVRLYVVEDKVHDGEY